MAYQFFFKFFEAAFLGFGQVLQHENQARGGEQPVDEKRGRASEIFEFPREDELHGEADRRVDQADEGNGDAANPVGKSSENSTHMTGPSEIAKLATNPSIPTRISVGFMEMALLTNADW